MNKKVWTGMAVLIFLVALGLGADLRQASSAAAVNQNVLASYDELEVYISGLSDELLSKGLSNSLLKKLENSEEAYLRGQPCTAANVLRTYLNETQALHRGKRLEIAEDLYNRGWTLYNDLLTSLPEGEVCSGHPRPGREPGVQTTVSDNQRFQATVTFSDPRMGTVQANGEIFTQLHFPGLETGQAGGGLANLGKPGVQMWHRLIAVPMGAVAVLRVLDQSSHTVRGVNLYPHQESPVDATYNTGTDLPPFINPPFIKDEEAYQQDAFSPPQVASIKVVGRMRDLNLVQLTVAPARYNPAKKILAFTERISFEVAFEGGSGKFLPARARNPFDLPNFKPVAEQSLLNGAIIYDYIDQYLPALLDQGEELLIITHPDFLDAANSLRSWKREKGIVTNVFKTGALGEGGIGATRDEIKNFITTRYEGNLIRPSYLLLLGDAEFIPCWYRDTGQGFIGTDLTYGLMNSGDDLADLAIARIPVDTLQEAQTVVDKIINYEKNPPTDENFYRNVSLPAYFQCCRADITVPGTTSRAFIQTMEAIRDHLVGQGYAVERIYDTSTRYHTNLPNPNDNYFGDPTPRRYYDGTLLPNDLLPASMGGAGFAWTGGSQDITDAINDGQVLVIHRDHGAPDGWGDPLFTTTDVNRLNNGSLTPVVFSINCASGLFDNETAGGANGTVPGNTYFVEAFLRKASGGAIGVLGDTRNSPTWANNALVRGFVDAIFPIFLTNYGGSNSIRRLADILNYGKLYMFSQVGISQPGSAFEQTEANFNNVIWHAFGDPTQEIWTSRPLRLAEPYYRRLDIFPDHLRVVCLEEGATITATQDGRAIGRGQVQDRVAILELVSPHREDIPIELSASKPNYIGTRLVWYSGE